jgi:hypothetical protein
MFLALRSFGANSERLLATPSSFFCVYICQNAAPCHCAPYQLISVNFILLDNLFRKKCRSRLIFAPFSTGEVTNLSTAIDKDLLWKLDLSMKSEYFCRF